MLVLVHTFYIIYMKKVFLPIFVGILLLSGCKEQDGIGLSGGTAVRSTDTTYMLTGSSLASLTTDPHQVLVEEFTGQSCDNCTKGHADLENFDTTHPGSLNYIGLYETNGGSLTQPVPGSANDFENTIAHAIGVYVSGSGVGNFPTAYIDRMPDISDGILVGIGNWDADIITRMAVPDSMNLAISSTYSGNTATIIATVTYTQPVNEKQSLTLDLIEDSIIDFQSADKSVGHTSVKYVDSTYLFTNVFRDMITTAPQGDAILDSVTVKERGRVYKHTYSYTLPTITGHPAINPAHCRVVGFVSVPGTAGNFEIMQSAQTKLMGP